MRTRKGRSTGRIATMAGLVACLAFGCGESRTGGPIPAADAGAGDAAPSTDAALSAPADMAQAGPLGCAGYVACVTRCAADASCADACDARLTGAGRALFQDGVGCGQAFCLDATSGRARCALDGQMTKLIDAPEQPAGSCTRCLTNALAALFGATCLPADSPDCDPPACADTVTQCQASTP